RKPPSPPPDMLVARVLESQLTCPASPPAAGTTYAFMNSFVPPDRHPTPRASRAHATGPPRKNGGRRKMPCASTRTCSASTDTTHSSFPSRRNATCLPSGENRGDTLCTRPWVSCVPLLVGKS